MQYIPLKNKNGVGVSTIIDDSDITLVSQFKWILHAHGYAVTGKRGLPLHRLLMKPSGKEQVDHINGNRLDNRRSNLRLCSSWQNSMNRSIRKSSKSGFKGVFWSKAHQQWRAKICVNYKQIHLGLFSDKAEAAKAYNAKAQEAFGEFARLNVV